MGQLTLLYDDGCALCVRLTAPLGRADGVSLVPIGSERGLRLLGDLSPAQRDASLHVVDERGGRWSGATALPLVLRRIRGGGVAARVVERFPRAAAHAYSLVARNRTWLSRPFRPRQARSVSRR